MVTASTIHMALLGAEGLERAAAASHANAVTLRNSLAELEGVELVFERPLFHEFVLRFEAPLDDVLQALYAQDLLPGYPLGDDYPELENCLLVCATEMRTADDIRLYRDQLERILGEPGSGSAPG